VILMARQPKQKSYDSTLSLAELQTDVRNQEAIFKQITELKTGGGKTISVHDNRTRVPVNSLELVEEDSSGNASGSAGSTRIFRGKAFISGTEKNVSAFRKGQAPATGTAAAGGTPAAPPSPAAGGTPPAPAAGGTPPAPAAGGTPPAPAAGGTPPAPAATPPAPAPGPTGSDPTDMVGDGDD
jgi:hypothetical protein